MARLGGLGWIWVDLGGSGCKDAIDVDMIANCSPRLVLLICNYGDIIGSILTNGAFGWTWVGQVARMRLMRILSQIF